MENLKGKVNTLYFQIIKYNFGLQKLLIALCQKTFFQEQVLVQMNQETISETY